MTASLSYKTIYEMVKKVPSGKVATYGQIAEECGFPGRARQIGYALAALGRQNQIDIPWHRVINAKGEVSLPSSKRQQSLLEKEGVVFKNGKTSLKTFAWKSI